MATLDEVAERFGLDSVFSDYPNGATIADLEVVSSGSSFDTDEWTIAEQYDDYQYISQDAILQLVYDQVWAFKRYYAMVDGQ